MKANKGKFVDVADWTLHLNVSLLGDSALEKYRKGVELADRGSNCIWHAVTAYFEDLGVGEFKRNEAGKFKRSDPRTRVQRQKVAAKAGLMYWSALDSRYQILIDAANDRATSLGGEWYKILRNAMNQAYEQAFPHQTARQLRAYAAGSKSLRLRRPDR